MKNDYHLQRMYQRFNKLYFDGELCEAIVGWDETLDDTLHGLTVVYDITPAEDGATHRAATIHLDVRLKPWKKYLAVTLLHEAAHVKLFPYMKHGRKFTNELRRLMSLGAYDGVL